jgi:glycosyltransferase involved in cell wall biosynthesis
VVAFRCGSVPEVLEHGVTGFVVDTLDEAVRAVERVSTISRQRCRQIFERRFTASRMADDYVEIYANLLAQLGPRPAIVA